MAKCASHFQHGKSVFTCASCGRSTRVTHQPDDCNCCYECWELAGYQNSVRDGAKINEVAADRDRLVSTIVSRGGSLEGIKGEFTDLWKTSKFGFERRS